MSSVQRVTLTLPADVLAQAREESGGNLSQFVASILRQHFQEEHLRKLHEELIAGYIANAEEAVAIAEEFRYADYEATMKYVPPSPDLEAKYARELSQTR